MDPEKRKRLEAAGFAFGDFADFLGMDDVERKEIEFRADLASAISKLRKSLKLTRPAFAKRVGVASALVDRLDIAAPEISLDLLLKAYLTLGGRVRYEFESPVVAQAAEPVSRKAPRRAAKPPRPRKVLKA